MDIKIEVKKLDHTHFTIKFTDIEGNLVEPIINAMVYRDGTGMEIINLENVNDLIEQNKEMFPDRNVVSVVNDFE